MKRIFLFLLLVPALGMGQVKNVVTVNRLRPRSDKIIEFEKVLASHAQKFHTGDWKWRVYYVVSGPDYGAYQMVEGPNSWDQLDARGDISSEHSMDFKKNLAPLTEGNPEGSYSVYREDLSTVQLTDYSDKIAVTHVYPKPGYGNKIEEILKKAKKAWENGNQTVAVYEASSSGPAQYILVYRYKQGLKERNDDFRKPFKERYNTVNGEDSYDAFLDGIRKYTDHAWSEMLTYRSELSSK
jgi:hypothetical protein